MVATNTPDPGGVSVARLVMLEPPGPIHLMRAEVAFRAVRAATAVSGALPEAGVRTRSTQADVVAFTTVKLARQPLNHAFPSLDTSPWKV